MAYHAKLSPSSAPRWLNCGGSVADDAVIASDSGSSYAADEGSAAHKLLENFIKARVCDTSRLWGEIEIGRRTFVVDDDMFGHVRSGFDYVAELTNGFTSHHCESERFYPLKHYGIKGLDGGTADVVVIDLEARIFHVIDFKYGSGVVVEVEDNAQLLCYARAVVDRFNPPNIEDFKINMTVIQPRAYHQDGPIRSWEISYSKLEEWTNQTLLPGARKAVNDPEYHAGVWCRWCPKTDDCPKRLDMIREVGFAGFDGPTKGVVPTIESLTAEQKIAIVQNADIFNKFIGDVQKSVFDEVSKGSSDYTGCLKIVEGRTNRKLTDQATDPEWSELLNHLPKHQVFIEKPRGIGEIEKNLKKIYKSDVVKSIMASSTFKPPGAKKLVPVEDKRPAIDCPKSDFADIIDSNKKY